MIRRYVWRFHVLAARMLFLQGRWDQARAQIFEARDQITGRQATLPSLLIATGAFDEAREFLERTRSQWRSDGTGRLQMPDAPIELAIWEGRWADARISYQRDLTAVSKSEELVIEARLSQIALRAEADSVEALDRDRDHAVEHHGRPLIDRLRTLGARRPARADGFGTELAAIVATAACEFLRLCGRADPEPWAQAVARWEALGMPYHAEYARWRLGEALAACGDLATADAELADALDTTAQLGAAPMADAIRALRRSVGLAADPPEPATHLDIDAAADELTQVEQLTRRERQVAAVLVEGRSNREIAERLYIAEGTASVHVSRILRKLGVSSRAEAISLLLRHERDDGHP